MVARIPLCEDWDEDILIWLLTSDGEYNVRSAYRLLVSASVVLCRVDLPQILPRRFGRPFGR